MYSIVLMLSLSGGADAPAADLGRGHDNVNRLACGRRRGGCHGCSGGCYGGCYGCSGCYGGYRYGCYGCCGGGCYGCWGGRKSGTPEEQLPKPGSDKDRTKPKPKPEGDDQGSESIKSPGQEQLAAPATIFVTLPTEATLTIDETPTRSTSATRVFVTPPLERGKVYHYTLKAKTRQDGRTLNTSERIAVQAGKETRVTLAFRAPEAASE
jgi:uncharacterized protein (TIGR03000 family)